MDTNIATDAVQSAVSMAKQTGFLDSAWVTIGGWPGFWSLIVAAAGGVSGLIRYASLAVRAAISIGLLWFFSHNHWVAFQCIPDFWFAVVLMVGLGMIGAWVGGAITMTAPFIIPLLFIFDVGLLIFFPAWILPGYEILNPWKTSIVFTIFNMAQIAVEATQL